MRNVIRFQERFGNLHPKMRMEWTQCRHLSGGCTGAVAHNPKYGIVTMVFQKALNAYLYIPWNSCHSEDSKRAWVKGELIQYVQISSKEEDFARIRKDFSIHLHARGYPGDRWKIALSPCDSNTDEVDPVHALKLTHNPLWDGVDLGPLWRELGEVWEEHGRGTPNLRFLASFSKPTSMGDQLNKNNWDILRAYHSKLAATV
ncbi:hypothetical protein BDP27DRAFT_1383945 [Rhodocollybia butyracea]|uniref:Helix-turn-helix domain-containing protein n=1 Tax=Rhodocollybia butyracea TaxID=206335 RepID=A0A9P5PQI8_9AGAR|nr:hypothetical protein BDP27DRAFT_1383945 [Rhodocollybia butyracea]